MLIIHHLQRSQSDRIIWLCEELGIPYELKLYARDPKTRLSPPEFAALHPSGTAPVIQDGPITLAESAAVFEYILTKYDPTGTLKVPSDAPNWPEYLYHLHFANGTLQPALVRLMTITRLAPPDAATFSHERFNRALGIVDARLRETKAWLAGEEFSAADIMTVCTLTTMRLFVPYSLAGYDGILAYLQRVSARPAWKAALDKGDPGFTPSLGAEVEK